MYSFTETWFQNTAKPNWDSLIPQLRPSKILEIGSYEGAATCYLIEKLGNINELDMYCIDTWEGSWEHKEIGTDMLSVEQRFDNNIAFARSKVLHEPTFTKLKGLSETRLMELFLKGHDNSFDFIYVDGSHATADVLSDGVLSFKLLKVGGVMVFDDYLWAAGMKNLDFFPKLAIDAFTTVYANKIAIISSLNTQVLVHKLMD